MAFQESKFIEIRPYLYHLTFESNLPRIQAHSKLVSASRLLAQSGDHHLIYQRRTNAYVANTPDSKSTIRDQQPLHAGNVDFEIGWDLTKLVDHLNQFVFLWPGKPEGPSDYGIRHFKRYANETNVMLRLKTVDMLKANHENKPLFCSFNSGAPRCSGGRKSPRGSSTFVTARHAQYNASDVVEVVFRDRAVLPQTYEVSSNFDGPWHKYHLPPNM